MSTTTEHGHPDSYGIRPPGYRLPDATHIGRVRLQVADLDRSIAYYESVIGLRVSSRAGAVAQLAPQGDDRVLVELHEKPGVRAVARRGHVGLYHFAILLPDRAVARPVRRAPGRARPVRRHVGPSRQRGGVSDGSRRTRHRGVRRPSALLVAPHRWPARDGGGSARRAERHRGREGRAVDRACPREP